MIDTIVVASTLDSFIRERERGGIHVGGGENCEYRLGRGQPLSKKRCSTCVKLSPLIDLSSSWRQRIDTGRLIGRSVEIVELIGVKKIRDVEATWLLYRECDAAQRSSGQSLLQRYYSSFSCGGSHYLLRDVTIRALLPLPVMIAQLIELLGSKSAGLPSAFVHGNPTVASISFLGKLPVPLKHVVPSLDNLTYSSPYLIQVDYGCGDSTAVTTILGNRSGVIVGDEPLGAIVVDTVRNTLTVRREASLPSFLREYPSHWRVIALHSFIRGLISLYPEVEVAEYKDIFPQGGSSAKDLREALEEMRGVAIPLDIEELLKLRIVSALANQETFLRGPAAVS